MHNEYRSMKNFWKVVRPSLIYLFVLIFVDFLLAFIFITNYGFTHHSEVKLRYDIWKVAITFILLFGAFWFAKWSVRQLVALCLLWLIHTLSIVLTH